MKTKVIALIAAVALITLSFTFINPSSNPVGDKDAEKITTSNIGSQHVVGFISDEVIK